MKLSQLNIVCHHYYRQTGLEHSPFADNQSINYTLWLGSNEFAWAIFHTSE